MGDILFFYVDSEFGIKTRFKAIKKKCPSWIRRLRNILPKSPLRDDYMENNVSEYNNEYVSEYSSKYVSEYTSEYISECTSECTSDYVREYISEYVSE